MNYIGSKLSLLSFLDETMKEFAGLETYDGLVCCDAFSGTGAVAKMFRENGGTVIANDLQKYSFVRLKHLLCNSISDNMNEERFNDFNALTGRDGFIYKNYCSPAGRLYYSDENGRACDAIRQEIELLHENRTITDNEYYWYLASLLEAIDKVANTASVYGAYLKKLKASAKKSLEIVPLPIVSGPKGQVYQEDANQLIRHTTGDILYLDPPYNNRQYAPNYHVLETIACGDEPEVKGVTGMRNYEEQKSDWCMSKKVENAFEELISHANYRYIFMSYNNEGLMSVDTVKDIMSRYGEYSLATKDYHRFKADKTEARNHKANSVTELLHCLKVS